MYKKTVLSKCEDGDFLASDVLNQNGVILVAKDTELNKFIRDRLMLLGIKNVSIYKTTSYQNNSNKSFKESYINAVVQTKRIFQDLVSGKSLDYHSISAITKLIHSNISENDNIVRCIANIQSTDEYTYTHCVNVAFYSMLIARWLKLSDYEIDKAIQSGFLHDVGKSKIPNEILNKRGVLTKEEFEVIKKHTILGHEIVDIDGIDNDIKKAVLLHHERIDGSGYPYSYRMKHMNLYSRIVAVADVFDAMTSDRVYKKRSTPFDTFEMFQTVGISMFDTNILNVFLNKLATYLIGSKVLLSNGDEGEIVFISMKNLSSPIIKISSGYLDFSKEIAVSIIKMI